LSIEFRLSTTPETKDRYWNSKAREEDIPNDGFDEFPARHHGEGEGRYDHDQVT